MAIVKFSGKPIEKLIDTVSKGIGILYEPKRIRKKADAEAYRLAKLEEAKASGLILKSDTEFEIIERARERFAHREINRQINLESIVEKSTKHLGETVSEEPVDEDWRTRFFNKAQDVTNKEMHEVWGKILAEEVTKPGKISFRTLEIVSNLSKNEAHLFELACKIALNDGRILKMSSDSAFDNYGVNFTCLLKLRAAGLIYDSDTLNITYKYNQLVSGAIINFGSKAIVLNKKNTKEYIFGQVMFTPSGTELMQIINADKNYDYMDKFIEAKQKEQFVFKFLKIK